MLTIWTLLALVVRGWTWLVCRSADRWELEYGRRSVAASKAAQLKPGTGRLVTSDEQQVERMRFLAPLFDRRDQAAAKWERRKHKAERLARWHHWLTKPRTLAGGLAGALTVPGVLVGLTAYGVDVPGVLTTAAEWVRATVENWTGV